jgi:hypothetical protein
MRLKDKTQRAHSSIHSGIANARRVRGQPGAKGNGVMDRFLNLTRLRFNPFMTPLLSKVPLPSHIEFGVR